MCPEHDGAPYMLLVSASRGPSLIHGHGLIAREFIPAGTVIWQFMPGFDVAIHESMLAQLSPEAHRQLVYYAYFNLEARTFVLSSDDDRFTNHSESPNTAVVDDNTVALIDIREGEEITIDYSGLVVLDFGSGHSYGVDLADGTGRY